MSRLEAVAQALYYPTPLRVVAGLARLLRIAVHEENGNGGKHLRILDPCAGKGLAVSFLARLLATQSGEEAQTGQNPDWQLVLPGQTQLSTPNKKGSLSTSTRFSGSNLIETYGIELDRYRAQAASTRMSQVLNTDAKTAKVSTNAFDLAFHNPPYDAAPGSERRLEHQFLKRVTWLLKPNGLLIHIIPQSSLAVSAEFLANHYHQIEVLRFPYPEYSRFGQVVVLALKKRAAVEDKALEKQLKQLAGVARPELKPIPACPTSHQELRTLLEQAGVIKSDQLDTPEEEESEISQELAGIEQAQFRQQVEELAPDADAAEFTGTLAYQLQPQKAVAGAKLIFAVGEYHLAEALVEASRSGVWSNRLTREQLTGGTSATTSSKTIHRPLMPLRDGQAALLTSLGLLNNLILTAEADPASGTPGQAIVVKGQALKEFKTRKIETDENGEETSRIDRQILRTELRTLDLANGELSLVQPAQMSQFIERYKPSIQRQMLENYPPRYVPRPRQTDPLIQQLEAGVARLGRRPLGGQRLALVGAALSLREQRGTVISAEQGSGKSYLGAGAAYLAGMRRVVVICPTHLTKKWVREISQTIPGAQGVVVKKISDLMQAGALIARHEYSLAQHLANQAGAKGKIDVSQCYGTKALPPFFVVISKESMKLDSRWEPAVMWRVPRPVPLDGKGRPILTEKAHCPRCGQLVTASYDDEQPIDWLTLQTKKRYCRALVRNGKGQRRECREPLWHKTAKKVGTSPFLSKKEQASQAEAQREAKAGPRRFRLARYIKEKLEGYFDLLILDEVQDMRSKGSAQGIAAGVLASACKKVLALSGTFSGGYSTSLFHLLYRFTDEIRHEYQPGDDLGWAWDYGIIERTTFRSGSNCGSQSSGASGEAEEEEEVLEDGAMSDRRTVRVRFKEAPGISPAVLLKMIGYTIFLKITDVARDLPPYHEHVLELPMQGENEEEAKAAGYSQHQSYQKLADDLYTEVRQQLLRGSRRLLGALVQSLLSWPDNPTLEETVIDKRDNKVVASAPALPEEILYPKEQALLDLYRRENSANRKLLVFISNTKKRDLAPRLKGVLEREAGARVAVLRSDKVEASDREAWVEHQLEQGIDVLICHPRLVQTGLDLLAFQTIVFYQIEYSVYVQRQASRRSWRIGQTQPIHVYHFVYKASSQAGALRHQARKMQASNLLEGDLSAEGLVGLADEDNEDNLMLEMARAIVREKEKAHLAVSQSGESQPQPEREREEEDATRALSLEDLLASLHQSEVGAAKLILEAGLNEELELEEAVTELYEALVAPTQSQILPQVQSEGQALVELIGTPVVAATSEGIAEPSSPKPKVSLEQLRELMLQEKARKHSRRNKTETQTAEKPAVPAVQQLSLF
jgi:hypothetical protein